MGGAPSGVSSWDSRARASSGPRATALAGIDFNGITVLAVGTAVAAAAVATAG